PSTRGDHPTPSGAMDVGSPALEAVSVNLRAGSNQGIQLADDGLDGNSFHDPRITDPAPPADLVHRPTKFCLHCFRVNIHGPAQVERTGAQWIGRSEQSDYRRANTGGHVSRT